MLMRDLHRNDQSIPIFSIRQLIDCGSIPDCDLSRAVLSHLIPPTLSFYKSDAVRRTPAPAAFAISKSRSKSGNSVRACARRSAQARVVVAGEARGSERGTCPSGGET